MKEIEENLLELERNVFKTKMYYYYDDNEYKRMKDVKDLFDLSVDEDCYETIITNSAFNYNYIQYESKGNKDKILTINEYLDMIRLYLSNIINYHKTQGEWRIHSGNTIIKHKTQSEWKIQLTMAINFISSKPDSDETRTMHTKSDNIEIMMGSETDEIIEGLFESLLERYQEGLEESMRGSEFIFDSVDALHFDLNKISLSRDRSCIDSSEWLKNKKATINPKNNDDRCFQCAVALALNHEQIKSHPERISSMKPFIDQYNWKEIDFSSHKKDWKKFESNNKSTALNILYVLHLTEEIRHAYK